MKTYILKLTEEEDRLFKQGLESLPSLAWTIIKKAWKRGDLKDASIETKTE